MCSYQWQVAEYFLKQISELDVVLGFDLSVESIHLVHRGGFMVTASEINALLLCFDRTTSVSKKIPKTVMDTIDNGGTKLS